MAASNPPLPNHDRTTAHAALGSSSQPAELACKAVRSSAPGPADEGDVLQSSICQPCLALQVPQVHPALHLFVHGMHIARRPRVQHLYVQATPSGTLSLIERSPVSPQWPNRDTDGMTAPVGCTSAVMQQQQQGPITADRPRSDSSDLACACNKFHAATHPIASCTS